MLGREVPELLEESVDASSPPHCFAKENKHMFFDGDFQNLETWFDTHD